MKKWMKYGAGVCLAWGLAISCPAEVKLFVIAGQSNADGRGLNTDLVSPYDQAQTNVQVWFDATATNWVDLAPGLCHSTNLYHGFELSLGKKLKDDLGGDVRLIKYAIGGTALDTSWKPGASLYNKLIGVIEDATNSLAGQPYTLGGLFWMQGEADSTNDRNAMANAYQTNLVNMIDGLRTHFSVPKMWVIIGRIQDDIGAMYTNSGIVRAAQVAVAVNDQYVNWIDTDTLGLKPDNLHYTSQGLIDMGALMADSYSDSKVLVSTNAVAVPEGGTNTFTVRLGLQPASSVTVSVMRVSDGDTDITVQSGSELIFTTTNWSSAQWVTLSAAQDADFVNGSAIIQCSGLDLPHKQVTATEVDDETDPAYELPWQETFENDGTNAGTLGALDGQHGWTATGVSVTNAEAQAGSQSSQLGDREQMSHLFVDECTRVKATFWINPVQLDDTDIADYTPPSDASSVFFVKTNGNIVAYSNTTMVTLNATASNGWNQFEVENDYVSKVWNMSMNGVSVFTNFAFYSTNQSAFSELIFEHKNAFTNAWVDTINIIDTQGAPDTDSDGIPDWWETLYYGGATNANSGDICSNGVNSVYSAYIAGLDPTNPTNRFGLSNLRNILQWNGVSGRVYTVYWTSSLLDGFNEVLHSNVTGGVFTDSLHDAEQKGFYRLEVQLEP